MIPKIAKNQGEFNEEEESLISLSSMPLIKKIQMELAGVSDIKYLNLRAEEFIEALCYDVITNHLLRMLCQTAEAVAELSDLQIGYSKIFKDFESEVSNTIRILTTAREQAFRRYNIVQQNKIRIQQEERYFDNKFEEFVRINEIEG